MPRYRYQDEHGGWLTHTGWKGPVCIAVTLDGRFAYVTNQISNTVSVMVSVISTATNTVVGAAIPVGNGPFALGSFVTPNIRGSRRDGGGGERLKTTPHPKPWQSQLWAHVDLIRRRRLARVTWAAIAEELRGFGVAMRPQAIGRFFKRSRTSKRPLGWEQADAVGVNPPEGGSGSAQANYGV
jgi:YVTN family beta-propeller protein